MTTADEPRTLSELRLVRRVKAGDTDAFGDLIRPYQKKVWLVCRGYVGPSEADAVSQEAFLKVYTRLASYDGRSKFSTWLVRIAINTSIDFLRREQRRSIVGDPPDEQLISDQSADPEERSRQRQAIRKLSSVLQGLPEGQRRVFQLRFFASLDLEEIAKILGVHVGTVKTQIHRSVHRVRREMEGFR